MAWDLMDRRLRTRTRSRMLWSDLRRLWAWLLNNCILCWSLFWVYYRRIAFVDSDVCCIAKRRMLIKGLLTEWTIASHRSRIVLLPLLRPVLSAILWRIECSIVASMDSVLVQWSRDFCVFVTERIFLQYKKPEDEDGFLMLKLTLNKTWSAYPISKVKKVLSKSLLLISRCSVMPITRSILWSRLLRRILHATCCIIPF